MRILAARYCNCCAARIFQLPDTGTYGPGFWLMNTVFAPGWPISSLCSSSTTNVKWRLFEMWTTTPPRGLCEPPNSPTRSEEHTSELQSRGHLVCRLLLEKKKQKSR